MCKGEWTDSTVECAEGGRAEGRESERKCNQENATRRILRKCRSELVGAMAADYNIGQCDFQTMVAWQKE